jgi:hypothetical protein
VVTPIPCSDEDVWWAGLRVRLIFHSSRAELLKKERRGERKKGKRGEKEGKKREGEERGNERSCNFDYY